MDWVIAVFVGSGCCSGLKEDCIFYFLYCRGELRVREWNRYLRKYRRCLKLVED